MVEALRKTAEIEAQVRGPRAKATAAELGLNPLARRLIALQLVTVVVALLLGIRLHLSISGWSAEAFTASNLFIFAGVWLYLFVVRGKSGSGESRVAETLFLLVIMTLFTVIVAVAQYPAVALGLPYADPWLARADAALGIDVAKLALWTARHPLVARLLTTSYSSLAPQFTLTILGLCLLRDRTRVWEFAFHFHTCLVVALIGLALWPAICTQAYLGFTPTLDFTRAIGQIQGFHDGSMTIIRLDELEGVVSLPSFHAAGALIVAWAWRGHVLIFLPVAALNLCLLASTFVTGVHYFVDVLAAALLFICSVVVYRGRPRRLLESGFRSTRPWSEGGLT